MEKKILPKDEWQAKINEVFYESPKHTNSRDSLFRAVREFGITRSYVDKFIRSQPDWQILQRPVKPKNTNTIMRFEPGYVQIDTIDIRNLDSEAANYLLTCTDIYTRKLWAYPLESLKASDVAEQLEKFINSYKLTKTIQSDNGNEFKDQVATLLEKQNITHVKSKSATPTSQSHIERKNGTLKRAIYGYKQKTGKDPIPELQSFLDSLNLQPNKNTKVAPAVALLPEYKEEILKNMETYNSKKREQGSMKDLEPGNKVRVLLEKTDIPANMKNKIKQQKGYLPKWSLEVYKIKKKSTSSSQWQLPYYTLDTTDNLENKKFNRADLLLVSDDTKEEKFKPKSQLISEFAEQDDLQDFLKNNKGRKMKGASGLEESDLFRFNKETKETQKNSRAERAARRSKL